MSDELQPNQDDSTPHSPRDENFYHEDPAIRPDEDPAIRPDNNPPPKSIPTWYIVVSIPLGGAGLILAQFGLFVPAIVILLTVGLFLYAGYQSRKSGHQAFWQALGTILGGLIAAGGLLVVGFFILATIALSAWGSSSGGGK